VYRRGAGRDWNGSVGDTPALGSVPFRDQVRVVRDIDQLRWGAAPTDSATIAAVKRIYLDMCSLKRPFDDQVPPRIRREAAAVASLIERAEKGEFALVRSPALRAENARNPREDRRLAAALWLERAAVEIRHSAAVETRFRDLTNRGYPPLDALHVAYAEVAAADALVSCDDRLLALGKRDRDSLRVTIINPCELTRNWKP
jgi:predicted nucleic acid-binding protein